MATFLTVDVDLSALTMDQLRAAYTMAAKSVNAVLAEVQSRKLMAEQMAATVATKSEPVFLPLADGEQTENGKPWQQAAPEDFAAQHAHNLAAAEGLARVTGSVAATHTENGVSATFDNSPVTEDGMYVLGETVYKVQKAVHGSGHLYAKQLVIHEGANATFEFAKGMIYKLRAGNKMTLEQAKEFGHLYGVCCKCGATLTDEKSIEAGIGPICAGKGW